MIVTDLAWVGIVVVMSVTIGWKAFLLVEVPGDPDRHLQAGVWLFYVQHNFDRTYWERHTQWDFFKAGLNGSSFYKLPGILQWFTGNYRDRVSGSPRTMRTISTTPSVRRKKMT